MGFMPRCKIQEAKLMPAYRYVARVGNLCAGRKEKTETKYQRAR